MARTGNVLHSVHFPTFRFFFDSDFFLNFQLPVASTLQNVIALNANDGGGQYDSSGGVEAHG